MVMCHSGPQGLATREGVVAVRTPLPDQGVPSPFCEFARHQSLEFSELQARLCGHGTSQVVRNLVLLAGPGKPSHESRHTVHVLAKHLVMVRVLDHALGKKGFTNLSSVERHDRSLRGYALP